MSSAGPSSFADDRPPDRREARAQTARFALRHATAQAHVRVDSLFSRFDLGSRAGYVDFLRAQAGAHLAVEGALDRAGGAGVIADWAERRRAESLGRDLRALGVDSWPWVEPPMFVDEAQILGGVYVLEGSRLGGALLSRSVPDDFPAEFLASGTPEPWRAFVGLLDRRLTTSALVDDAAASAIATFAAFERSAHLALETVQP